MVKAVPGPSMGDGFLLCQNLHAVLHAAPQNTPDTDLGSLLLTHPRNLKYVSCLLEIRMLDGLKVAQWDIWPIYLKQ